MKLEIIIYNITGGYMGINTELYKVFYYVCKCGSISHAAKELYISQPAVSKSIMKLESITGCVLFIRHAKGVKLTTEGEALFCNVRMAFSHFELAEKTITNLKSGDYGRVKVGISNTLCKYYFMPKLKLFHKKFPRVTIKVVNAWSPKSISLLESGDIDFAIITYSKMKDGYEYYPLMDIHDVFVSSNKSDVELGVDAIKNKPIMLLEKGNQTRNYIESYFAASSIKIKPEIEIGSMDFLVEFARIGIGISCVIKEFIKDELERNDLYQIPIYPEPIGRKIGVVVRRGVPLTNATRNFIDLLY